MADIRPGREEREEAIRAYAQAAVFLRHLRKMKWEIPPEQFLKLKDMALKGDVVKAEEKLLKLKINVD